MPWKILSAHVQQLSFGLFLSFLVAVIAFGIFINRPQDHTLKPGDVCQFAQGGTRDQALKSFLSKNADTRELATNYGQCSAVLVQPNFWYAKGTIRTKAMDLHRVQPRAFEAIVHADNDVNNPYVKAYGPQLHLCSYSVDGAVNVADYANKKICGRALEFDLFKRQAGI